MRSSSEPSSLPFPSKTEDTEGQIPAALDLLDARDNDWFPATLRVSTGASACTPAPRGHTGRGALCTYGVRQTHIVPVRHLMPITVRPGNRGRSGQGGTQPSCQGEPADPRAQLHWPRGQETPLPIARANRQLQYEYWLCCQSEASLPKRTSTPSAPPARDRVAGRSPCPAGRRVRRPRSTRGRRRRGCGRVPP